MQEYENKKLQKQNQAQSSGEPCSPLMSPSQHSSPMHSPAGLVSHSPGPGSVPSMVQHSPVGSMVQHSPNPPLLQHSPGNPTTPNPGTMSPHSNMQQASPRIGTPHSQGEESPFSPGVMPSPSGICGPPTPRMTSPQHRTIITGRMTTSPGAFTQDSRNAQQIIDQGSVRLHNIAQRFVRPAIVNEGPRLRMPVQVRSENKNHSVSIR